MALLTELVGVLNIDVTNAAFSAVQIPADTVGKSLILKSRNGFAFHISDAEDGVNYYTVTGVFSLDLLFSGGTTVFYVRGTDVDVIEALLFD